MSSADREAYQKRLDRISELLGGIVAHAEVSSLLRCPYRDRHDQCTALFRCRNQLGTDPDAFTCGHDGTFDYRTAWETHPRARERVKRQLAEIKSEAEARRRNDNEGPAE